MARPLRFSPLPCVIGEGGECNGRFFCGNGSVPAAGHGAAFRNGLSAGLCAHAQDVYQEAFLRLALCKREFADDEHVKA